MARETQWGRHLPRCTRSQCCYLNDRGVILRSDFGEAIFRPDGAGLGGLCTRLGPGRVLFRAISTADGFASTTLGRLCTTLGRLGTTFGRLCLSLGRLCLSLGRLCLSLGRLCTTLGRLCSTIGGLRSTIGGLRLSIGGLRLSISLDRARFVLGSSTVRLASASFGANYLVQVLRVRRADEVIEHIGWHHKGGGEALPVLACDVEAVQAVEPGEAIIGDSKQFFPSGVSGDLTVGRSRLDDHDPGAKALEIRTEKNVPFRTFHVDLQEIDIGPYVLTTNVR